jgi:hypothetical protein
MHLLAKLPEELREELREGLGVVLMWPGLF